MTNFRRIWAVLSLTGAALLAACGGGGSSTSASGTTGTLRVSLTDAPACGFDQVNVTIQKVQVNQSASASDSDPGWIDIALNPALRVDLLTLSNGVLAELGQVPLAAGHYSQMRLVLAENSGSDPLANSVVPTGGSEQPLTTPSAQQTGLKINVDLDVQANQMVDMVLDFDACKSVVTAGASGKYILKPVVKATPAYISGVGGYVDAALANGLTTVSLQQDGVVIKATAPDATGKFLLQPVAPGSYDFVITSPGYATLVVTGVTVDSGLVTTVSTSGMPLLPPLAGVGTLAGVVTTPAVSVDAQISAAQHLGNGDWIVVGSTLADADSGAYALDLPAAAPWVAPYVAGGSLVFAADATAGNAYTLNAESGGVLQTAGPLTVGTGTTVTTNFAF